MTEVPSAGFPLSPEQRYLWSLQQQGNIPPTELALLIEGNLDPGTLKHALQRVVGRHEILRTEFQRRAGMKFPLQVIKPEPKFHWEERTIAPDDAHPLAAVTQAILGSLRAPDLNHSGVLRACLAKIGANQALLLLSAPALCSDIISLRNVAEEIVKLYSEPDAALPEVFQYADYSEWANGLLQSPDAEAEAANLFWNAQDPSDVPPLSLPFEKKRTGGLPEASQSFTLPIDGVSWNTLAHAGGRTEDFLFTCWQVLLKRLTTRAEIVSSYISDGRNHEELRSAVGFFSKPLPLYVNLNEPTSTRSLLKSVSQLVATSSEHQDYLSVERLAERPMIRFCVERPLQAMRAGEATVSEAFASSFTTGSHLQLNCTIGAGNCAIALRYDQSCFDPGVAEQYAKRFAVLLKAAVSDPTISIDALPVMEDSERQQVLSFSKTAANYPAATIHELFERQAALTPNRPALRFMGTELSYSELNAESNRVAHRLRKIGVKANVAVGLCVERSAEMIVGLLGILKAGGCYVPLVPDNPKARLGHQLSETGAPVVLTQQKFLDRLPDFAGQVICLDRDRASLQDESDGNPRAANTPDDRVYIIYTSGSTGVPKGVAVRHRSLVNYSHFIATRLKLAEYPEGLHFATVSTISADLGNTSIFPALISGGCLHVISYETAMASNLFTDYVAKHSVDVLKITPSHLKALLQNGDEERLLPRKYLLLGGEAFHWDLLDRIRRVGKCTVLNHYGPTEATVGCCTFSPAEVDVTPWQPSTVPIGRPVANDEVYILNQQLQPTPIGVAGELCIGGAGLAEGYLNRAEETAQRFTPHPFSGNGERLYRTGDLARFLPTGDIEFFGRIDDQVKIRGFRVEPAETESLLKKHPSVQEVAIIACADSSGDNQLAAYVVTRKPATADELRQFLMQQVPDYMVPAAFMFLDRLPLTPNGKVDRRALPSPQEAKVEREFVGARNPEEEKLVAIWTEVLKLDRVSVLDSFFDLGGHSLLATQIISRIRNGFRVQLPLHSFLETPTIAAVAEKIRNSPVTETEEDEIARLLQELEGLSEEEAERLLASQDKPSTDAGAKSGKASA